VEVSLSLKLRLIFFGLWVLVSLVVSLYFVLWLRRASIKAALANVCASLKTKVSVFDWRDGLLLIGAGMVFHGVYILMPAIAYIVLGCACVWFALFSERRK
jgi:hypothetical protein